ncbi:MAG: hypothetical protein Q9190_001123 [Brigantiaea leucoxantha]
MRLPRISYIAPLCIATVLAIPRNTLKQPFSIPSSHNRDFKYVENNGEQSLLRGRLATTIVSSPELQIREVPAGNPSDSRTSNSAGAANPIQIRIPHSFISLEVYPSTSRPIDAHDFYHFLIYAEHRIAAAQQARSRAAFIVPPFSIEEYGIIMTARTLHPPFFTLEEMACVIEGLKIYDRGLTLPTSLRIDVFDYGHHFGQVQLRPAGPRDVSDGGLTLKRTLAASQDPESALFDRDIPEWTSISVKNTETNVSVLPISTIPQDPELTFRFLSQLNLSLSKNVTAFGRDAVLDDQYEHTSANLSLNIWSLTLDNLTLGLVVDVVSGLEIYTRVTAPSSLLRLKVLQGESLSAAGLLGKADIMPEMPPRFVRRGVEPHLALPRETVTDQETRSPPLVSPSCTNNGAYAIRVAIPLTPIELDVYYLPAQVPVPGDIRLLFNEAEEGVSAVMARKDCSKLMHSPFEYQAFGLRLVLKTYGQGQLSWESTSEIISGLKLFAAKYKPVNIFTFEVHEHSVLVASGNLEILDSSTALVRQAQSPNLAPSRSLTKRAAPLHVSGTTAPATSIAPNLTNAENAIHIPIPYSDGLALNVYLLPHFQPHAEKFKALIDSADELITELQIKHGPKTTVKSFARNQAGLLLLIGAEAGYALSLEDLAHVVIGLKIFLIRHHPVRFFKFDIFWSLAHVGVGEVEEGHVHPTSGHPVAWMPQKTAHPESLVVDSDLVSTS